MKHPVTIRRRLPVVAPLLLFCLAAISACAPGYRSVTFFYEAVCASCEDDLRMEHLAGSVVGLEASIPNLSAEAFNLYEHGGLDSLDDALESAGLESSSVSFPLLIVGDEVHEGEAAVRAEIERLRDESR